MVEVTGFFSLGSCMGLENKALQTVTNRFGARWLKNGVEFGRIYSNEGRRRGIREPRGLSDVAVPSP